MHGMGWDGLRALSDLALASSLACCLWLLPGDVPVLAHPARCHVSWVDL